MKRNVKWSRYSAGVAQRVGRGTALLLHDRGSRREWVVSSTPRRHFTPGKDPVSVLQEAGWAPGPVWTGWKSCPNRDSILDRPARSSVAIPTELPGPNFKINRSTHNVRQITKRISKHSEHTKLHLRQRRENYKGKTILLLIDITLRTKNPNSLKEACRKECLL